MIFEKIRTIVADQTGKDESEIKMETNFRVDIEADSLDLFQIINDIEDEFNVKIEDLEGINTVEDVVKFVEEQTRG